MNLNVKDCKILANLDLNARATYSEIGKEIGLSRETVQYRIHQLEKQGVLKGYALIVNFSKLGYTGFVIYARLKNTDEAKKSEMIKYFSMIPELYWVGLVGGKFDIVLGVLAKNVFQFNKIYYNILNKYGEHLVDPTVAIRSELRYNRRDYLTGKKPDAFIPPYFGKDPQNEILDKLDSDVISALSSNARISALEIAKILKKPASTIMYRIKDLERKKIIVGSVAYIRPLSYGMQSYRLLLHLHNMDEQMRNSLFEYAHCNPNILLAIENVGSWDFEMTLEVKNHEALQQEISKLRDQFPKIIREIEFLIMFEDDIVHDYYPFNKGERDPKLMEKYIRI